MWVTFIEHFQWYGHKLSTKMVNTFLVCENFEASAKELDHRRLGKQRVEAFQILNILKELEHTCMLSGMDVEDIPSADTDPTKEKRREFVKQMRVLYMKRHPERKRPPGWWSHPAVFLWIGYRRALETYLSVHIREWIRRGFKNTMVIPDDDQCSSSAVSKSPARFPSWVSSEAFHKSHRQSLFHKSAEMYPQFAQEGPFVAYLWP